MISDDAAHAGHEEQRPRTFVLDHLSCTGDRGSVYTVEVHLEDVADLLGTEFHRGLDVLDSRRGDEAVETTVPVGDFGNGGFYILRIADINTFVV